MIFNFFYRFGDFFLFCDDEIIGIENKYIKIILLILNWWVVRGGGKINLNVKF